MFLVEPHEIYCSTGVSKSRSGCPYLTTMWYPQKSSTLTERHNYNWDVTNKYFQYRQQHFAVRAAPSEIEVFRRTDARHFQLLRKYVNPTIWHLVVLKYIKYPSELIGYVEASKLLISKIWLNEPFSQECFAVLCHLAICTANMISTELCTKYMYSNTVGTVERPVYLTV